MNGILFFGFTKVRLIYLTLFRWMYKKPDRFIKLISKIINGEVNEKPHL